MVRNDLGATVAQDSSTFAAGTRSFKASIPTASTTQPWQVQVRQGNQALSAGKRYTVSFAAKASTARPILVTLQQASTPYTAYWQQSVGLSTNWTTYRYTVTAPSSDAAALLSFSLAQATGQVWLDNVVITPQ